MNVDVRIRVVEYVAVSAATDVVAAAAAVVVVQLPTNCPRELHGQLAARINGRRMYSL